MKKLVPLLGLTPYGYYAVPDLIQHQYSWNIPKSAQLSQKKRRQRARWKNKK